MIRRVCIFGGPGVGKSTFSPELFAALKKRKHNVEYVGEYVKTWAIEGKFPKGYDQVYLFAKQMHNEERFLRHVDLVVTECPIFLAPAYAKAYKFKGWEQLLELCQQFDKDYKPLNVYLKRTVPYVTKGRFQSEKDGKKFDTHLRKMMDSGLKDKYHVVTVDMIDDVIKLIEA